MNKQTIPAESQRPGDFQAIRSVIEAWEENDRKNFLDLLKHLEPEVPGLDGMMEKAISERVFESLTIAASLYTKNVEGADVRHVLYVLCGHFAIEPHFALAKKPNAKQRKPKA